MTAVDDNDTLDTGQWGVIVARVAQSIRRECGEATANRVVTALHSQKDDAIEAMRAELDAANRTLETTLGQVTEARRAHERLQLDLSRMGAAVRDARAEAAAIRAQAENDAAGVKGALASAAEAESERVAEAWQRLRQQEGEVARRRAELMDLDEQASLRMAEIDSAERELLELRAVVDHERAEATRMVDEALAMIDRREAAATEVRNAREGAAVDDEIIDLDEADDALVAEGFDLRDGELDLRETVLSEREAELVEWETDLVRRTHELEQRAAASPTLPPPGRNVAGWGSRRTG